MVSVIIGQSEAVKPPGPHDLALIVQVHAVPPPFHPHPQDPAARKFNFWCYN